MGIQPLSVSALDVSETLHDVQARVYFVRGLIPQRTHPKGFWESGHLHLDVWVSLGF